MRTEIILQILSHAGGVQWGMRLLARLVGVVVALGVFAVLMRLFELESRAAQAALLVLCLAIGGIASEYLLQWLRRR